MAREVGEKAKTSTKTDDEKVSIREHVHHDKGKKEDGRGREIERMREIALPFPRSLLLLSLI